jgi:signal transduction histidine kinase
MQDRDHNFHRSGLAFFGKVTAGISHEIKNGLAVIKEESGLALDLMTMAEKGRPLDSSRIKELVEKIFRRVDSVDEFVKDLNRFSHSVDDPDQVFDLRDLLTLTARLSERFARMNDIELRVVLAPYQLQLESDPFLLHHLLFIFMEAAINNTEKGGRVTVAAERSGSAVCCVFDGISNVPLRPGPDRNEMIEILSRTLKCEIEYNDKQAQTFVRLPIIIETA